MIHPMLVVHATALSASAVAGQFFIYSMVKEFGALVFAASMNLRQVISILTSYWLYSHPIAMLQAFALVIVFGTLFYKSYLGWSAGDKHGSRNEAGRGYEMVQQKEGASGKVVGAPCIFDPDADEE